MPQRGQESPRSSRGWILHPPGPGFVGDRRCHRYRDRVGHVDPLHVDLWAEGINLLRDCGSYAYFAPDEPDLEYYFKSIWRIIPL